ncbi:hypothetical protein LCGC14_0796680 [marine sediment metagenome]|uniref:Uncharacterized protein n=1 Tax=marine sediment metagenome TaxID=412755 RepID=A0A0F9PVC0_9ZZZZ
MGLTLRSPQTKSLQFYRKTADRVHAKTHSNEDFILKRRFYYEAAQRLQQEIVSKCTNLAFGAYAAAYSFLPHVDNSDPAMQPSAQLFLANNIIHCPKDR